MKKQLLFFLLIFIFSISHAKKDIPEIFPNFKGLTLSQVKKHNAFTILTEVSGDLNHDRKNDLALILETKDSIYEKRESKGGIDTKGKARVLLVFLNQNGKQVVHTQNNKFIARPYENRMIMNILPLLYIENNQLIIFYEFVRASRSYTFKLINTVFLITYSRTTNVYGTSFIYTDYDFLNHKLITTQGHITYGNERMTSLLFNVEPKALHEFEEMYTWEVLPDHSL